MIRGAEEPLGRAQCEMLGGVQSAGAASGRDWEVRSVGPSVGSWNCTMCWKVFC